MLRSEQASRRCTRSSATFPTPHSAVGYNASKAYGIEGFWLSTAHQAKFREVIADTLGREFPIPEGLQIAMRKQKHFHPMDVSVAALEEYIEECVRG